MVRRLLVIVALVTVVAACSSSSKTPEKAAASSTTSTTALKGKNPCDLLDRKDLSQVTGITFDASQPGQDSCIYTSTEGLAAIALNFTSLGGNEPKQALGEATSTCDAGTVVPLTFRGTDGGFSCTVKGVATVGATGSGIFAVLTGATVKDEVPTQRILQDLATILEHAITGP
jgi:hypothetical protein